MPNSRPRMRPTFDLETTATPDCVLRSLKKIVDDAPEHFRLRIAEGFADLHVPSADEHFFSPTLLISANAILHDPDDDTLAGNEKKSVRGTQLHCRFSPPANVWTGFMALYAVLSFVGIGGLMYGISQWMIQSTPWALAGFPASLALIGFVYGATFIGQGLGSEQMYQLRHLIDKALEEECLDDATHPKTDE